METNKAKSHHPHQKLFSKVFKKKEVIQDILQKRLQPESLATIDFQSLQVTAGSLGHLLWKDRYSAVIFTLNIQDKPGYLCVLLEQQAQGLQEIARCLLSYKVLLMQQHIEAGHRNQPALITLVLYAENQPKQPAQSFQDAFENSALFKQLFAQDLLIELHAKEYLPFYTCYPKIRSLLSRYAKKIIS